VTLCAVAVIVVDGESNSMRGPRAPWPDVITWVILAASVKCSRRVIA
jgi:hypothetical protein